MEDFETIIKNSTVTLGLTGAEVADVIEVLVDALVEAGGVPANLRDGAVGAVLEREALGSTAISCGIAIPHGYLDGVSGTKVAIGVHPEGIDCAAPDGEKSHIFVMMLNSSKAATGHIKFLVSLNQLLLQPEVCRKIREAKSRDEVVATLCRK